MRTVVALLILVMLGACGSKAPSGPPVVVYASLDDPANLPELFAEFTAATGIPITANWGDSRANADAVIGKQGVPADVLITNNVTDIWRAADQGALRPLRGELITSVPVVLKDPDKQWVALQRRFIVIANSPKSEIQRSGNYAALAQDQYKGKLCLSSLENSVNQALLAMLIEDLGLKPAERVVRGWMMNLAIPPLATEAKLVAALESGACQYGIISTLANTIQMTTVGTVPVYIDVSAMGVGRHANYPQRAQQLVDWLIVNKPLEDLAESNGRNIGVVGWRSEDVRLLADRVGYH